MTDKISKLMNDFRIIGTKYNLDKISDEKCHNELKDVMNELLVEFDNEKNNLEETKIIKKKIQNNIIKLVILLSENELPSKKSIKNKNSLFDSENSDIEKIIKSILDKIKDD